jgi:hypothetical protein
MQRESARAQAVRRMTLGGRHFTAAAAGVLLAGAVWSVSSGLKAQAPGSIRYDDFRDEPITLSLESMTSLPNGVAFLGGSFRTPAVPVHSCLLMSRDEGKTWSRMPQAFIEATVSRLVSYGTRMVWALVVNSKEGAEEPQSLLVSRDAGTTWETIPWKWNPPGTLLRVEDFRFLDEKHGIALVRNSVWGSGAMFQSSDSGKSWRRIWNVSPAPDGIENVLYPTEPEPLHTSVWVRQEGYTTPAQGLLRVVEDEAAPTTDRYIVQRIVYWQGRAPRSAIWETVGEIPREYVIDGGTLKDAARAGGRRGGP